MISETTFVFCDVGIFEKYWPFIWEFPLILCLSENFLQLHLDSSIVEGFFQCIISGGTCCPFSTITGNVNKFGQSSVCQVFHCKITLLPFELEVSVFETTLISFYSPSFHPLVQHSLMISAGINFFMMMDDKWSLIYFLLSEQTLIVSLCLIGYSNSLWFGWWEPLHCIVPFIGFHQSLTTFWYKKIISGTAHFFLFQPWSQPFIQRGFVLLVENRI